MASAAPEISNHHDGAGEPCNPNPHSHTLREYPCHHENDTVHLLDATHAFKTRVSFPEPLTGCKPQTNGCTGDVMLGATTTPTWLLLDALSPHSEPHICHKHHNKGRCSGDAASGTSSPCTLHHRLNVNQLLRSWQVC